MSRRNLPSIRSSNLGDPISQSSPTELSASQPVPTAEVAADSFHIRPTAVGARLFDPGTADCLVATGEWKPRSTHWLRLELRGDVEQCSPPADNETVESSAVDQPEPTPPETPATFADPER